MFDAKQYLQKLPDNSKSRQGFRDWQAFKEWLKTEADADAKRGIVREVERRIKRIAGNDYFIPHVDEKTWGRLKLLVEIRQIALDELMLPTPDEVRMMGELNDRLLDITRQLYRKAAEMWKVLNDAHLNTDDYCVEGAIDFSGDNESGIKKLDNDYWYGSDFNYMLWKLAQFDKADRRTMSHLHEILQNFGMSEEEAVKDCADFLDDGDTWTDGRLWNPAFKDITVCYLLHAVCCHFHYSLADVLRMDSFTVMVHAEYEHGFHPV